MSPDPSFVRVARYTHDLCPCGSAVRIVPGVTLVFRTRVEWLRLRLESEDIDVQVFLSRTFAIGRVYEVDGNLYCAI